MEFANQTAQYSKEDGTPRKYWTDAPRMINGKLAIPKKDQIVDTVLSDLDTSEEHFVKVPLNHIVIDFDLKDENGDKSLEMNLSAASLWPPTYAELSKSGNAVHLHYVYDGDVSELSPEYSTGIEVKVYTGNSALRRKLTKCNNVPVATINSGLPIKEKKMLHSNTIRSEKGLREMIARNFKKEFQAGTKPSIDFINTILDDVYNDGLSYDVTDLRPKLQAFALNSTNHPLPCLKIVQKMKLQGQEEIPPIAEPAKDDRIVCFDIEVYPNLFVVCWKYEGDDNVVRMINPSAQEVEALFRFKLVGFNNRRYDNHILYARYMDYSIPELYKLSQKIINNERSAMFGEAYNLSYTDIYDFSSKKQGLKMFEIELGLPHMEMDLPWDEDVADEDVAKVVDYCVNDVLATEETFESRKQDFVARQILAELSGLSVNDTTQKHTARIIFGNDRNPQRSFVYTDLTKEFPGYVFEKGKSTYKGEDVGEGGYVYAEPGIYNEVALLDVASMHPTTIVNLNLFGDEYTPRFAALLDARLAIKREDYKAAKGMLDGKLKPYLNDKKDAQALAYALKIVINIVYGLTSAKFDNPFRDIRNVDNIVAKRGALFMIDLKEYVQSLGFIVAHIKTDSIKIPNATHQVIEAVTLFGQKYGYDFEHESTYEKFCLVNEAVYIASVPDGTTEHWIAVGAQFQHPYVYKTLFSKEDITFDDLCETKHVVQGAMHLDFDHTRPMFLAKPMHFVGRTGRFVPVTARTTGAGGGILYRVKDDKYYAVTGTNGYLWMEAEVARTLGDALEIDMSYFENLAETAIKTIEKFGSFKELVSDCE